VFADVAFYARVLSYIPDSFSTTINSVNRKIARTGAILLVTSILASCSGLSSLTPDILDKAEAKWRASEPPSYHLVIEMKGDRVDKEVFDVTVKGGQLTTLRRNGLNIQPSPEQDYSMDGLFRVLHQEMALMQKPTLLGAPEGYSAYPMGRFDDQTGRLIEYRRTVGGTSNTIDIRVIEYTPL
jgi:hypothetical protein